MGLKWRETRKLLGKTATETMWITDAAENKYYHVGAESHGFIYISTLSISGQSGGSLLTMTHESKAQGFLARLLSILPGFVLKRAMKNAILKDLNDIKAADEQQGGGQPA